MVPYFEQRNVEIQNAFPDDRLLTYEVRQGWEPLCAFLELPVPDTPFPHINSRDETAAMIESMMATSGTIKERMADAAGDLFGDKREQE